MFTNEPLPADGYITLPDTPGFGLELNKEALNLIRPFDRSGESAAAVLCSTVRQLRQDAWDHFFSSFFPLATRTVTSSTWCPCLLGADSACDPML